MIVKNVCLLLEALSIVICLHHLYGEKFRLDIATISLLAVDMIMMQAIDYFKISGIVSGLIYPVIVIYCVIQFRPHIKELLLNLVLCVVLVGGTQLLVMVVFYYVLNTNRFANVRLLIVNVIVFLGVTFLYPYIRLKFLINLIKSKEKIMYATIGTSCTIVALWLISYKEWKTIELNQALLLFISMIFIFMLSSQLIKYKVKAKEAETELRMQKLYSDSFKGLIDDIRMRQHEFNNHINTIYSQHYTCHTYEELVDTQKKYCGLIIGENYFYKLLLCRNPVIAGFLYGRFVEINKMGINISYEVSIKNLEIDIPIYKIVEILGDLMNNAVEALLADKERDRLQVSVIETERLYIEVKNESSYVEYNELASFFTKGYSKKGENRGLGLYNVKQICEEYEMEILCKNTEVEGDNWLVFALWKEKGAGH